MTLDELKSNQVFSVYEIEGKRCNDVVVPVNRGLEECSKVPECPVELDVFVWSARHGIQFHFVECTRRRRGHDEEAKKILISGTLGRAVTCRRVSVKLN